MKCSSDCKFLTSINSKGKIKPYCSRTGWDINDLPKEVIENCPKFIDKNYIQFEQISIYKTKNKIDIKHYEIPVF